MSWETVKRPCPAKGEEEGHSGLKNREILQSKMYRTSEVNIGLCPFPDYWLNTQCSHAVGAWPKKLSGITGMIGKHGNINTKLCHGAGPL